MIKYRHCLRQLLILIIVTGIPTGARADIDRKFHDKAAQAVWSMDMPQFDPDTDLSDSIYSGKAAVYIARYRLLKATHDESLNNTKAMMTGIRNTNAINAVGIDRAMVKILDSSALDQFNSFEIPAPQKLDVYGLTMSSVTPTFGARITKPDGTVENIDIEEALTVTQGKNNSDASYKITIPGLEPGTVLDYFFYTEYFMDEISMPALKFIFMKEYPTKDFMLEMAVSSSLAMEYSHYNGAPDFSRKWTDGKYNCLSLHLSGMDAIETTMPFFSEARQVPCIEFRIINPTARMSSLRSTRGGGVRITAPYLLSDAASEIKNEKSPEKTLKDATSIMKKWKKNNPDASMREIVDAAFVALNFSCQKNQERHHQLQFCKSYSRLLENLSTKLPGRVAISSPRNAARIDDLASHSQAHYFVTVGDSCYFPSNSPLIAPGDIPEYFDSEKAYIYDGAPYRDNLHTAARSFTIPRSRPKDNTYETVSEVRLHLDSIWTMNVSTTFTANGTAKDMMNGTILPYEVQDEYARFLGQSPSKPLDRDQLLFLTTLQRKEMTERAKLMWDCDRVLLYNYEVKSIGCTPDRPVATFLLEGMLLDMTSTAGSDILVNIGKLIGHQYEVKGMQRKRDISVINPSAYQQRHTIRLEIPEGYEVVPQSVTALNRNISSPVATFFVEASIDNGYVVLRTIERHSASVAPASAWPDILKVLDTAFEFNSATIALRRLGNNSESQSTTPN